MAKKNNYRETILHLKAQVERAIVHLSESDPSQDWEAILKAEGYELLTPEYREKHMQQVRAKARSNLKPNAGRRPEKTIVVDGKETTYKQLAQGRGVTVSTVRNQILKERRQAKS
jgi:hypothetical protein